MIREFFYLQKSDRKVMIALLIVMVIALGVIIFTGREQTAADGQQQEQTGEPRRSRHKSYPAYSSYKPRKVERFAFDPNTADSTQLLRLGLQPWQVRNIYKYRAAGGIYRQPSDFARLYGLTVKQYRELEPYIRISSDYLPASTLLKTRPAVAARQDTTARQHYPVKLKPTEQIVLNTADTTALMTVPGIGPYFAKRIIAYGNRLGGYVEVDQLDEIEDFPSEAKQYLVVDGTPPRQLNINRLSLNELKRHPYINFFQAKAITDYRRLHGPIRNLSDLRLSKDFPPEAIARLAPYVTY